MEKIDQNLALTVEEYDASTKTHNGPIVGNISNHFNIDDCKPASTPLPAGFDLLCDVSECLGSENPYRHVIGALMQLCNTLRSDICYALNFLVRFMHALTEGL